MNRKLYNIFGAALALLMFVGCSEKDESGNYNEGDGLVYDDFDVQFVLPDAIYSDGEIDVTFTVIDEKAPLLTDTFVLEPLDFTSEDGYYYSCTIIDTSPESFTVTVPFYPQGRYNAYIQRSGKMKFYGMISLALPEDRPLKILFIGNSFTRDAVYNLPGMIAAAGLRNIKLVHMYFGGRTIPTFYQGYMYTDDYTCYTCLPNTDYWTETTGLTLHDAVLSDTWDFVSIQEYTGTYYAWEWTDDEKQAIQGLIDYIKVDQGDNDPKIEYIMSQAFSDFSIIPSSSQSHITFSTIQEMFYVIAAQGEKVLAETTVDEILPTGTMLENLRTTSYNNELNLSRDGYHMDYGISRYGASCVVFESVISPIFGVYLDDNTYRISDGVAVTDENQPVALLAARNAMANPFVITDMSGY